MKNRMSVSLKRSVFEAFKKEVHHRGEFSIDGTAEKIVSAELDRVDLIAKAHSNLQNRKSKCLKRN